jgi:hypothetical protein
MAVTAILFPSRVAFALIAILYMLSSSACVSHGLASSPCAVAAAPEVWVDPRIRNSVDRYLKSLSSESTRRFLVHGWRWHSLSFVRDADRLGALAIQQLRELDGRSAADASTGSSSIDDDALDRATAHVIDFSLAGLDRIENELFFPWLREKLCGAGSSVPSDMVGDFDKLITGIAEERDGLSKLARTARTHARAASSPSAKTRSRRDAMRKVAEIAATLSRRMRKVIDVENALLVPAVAMAVPEREQRSFNSKVIRKLGVLDSRLHLVGMRDAVWECADARERELFEEEIPYLARTMINRWRRTLYSDKAGVLELSVVDDS